MFLVGYSFWNFILKEDFPEEKYPYFEELTKGFASLRVEHLMCKIIAEIVGKIFEDHAMFNFADF